jgi:hypothetical protein
MTDYNSKYKKKIGGKVATSEPNNLSSLFETYHTHEKETLSQSFPIKRQYGINFDKEEEYEPKFDTKEISIELKSKTKLSEKDFPVMSGLSTDEYKNMDVTDEEYNSLSGDKKLKNDKSNLLYDKLESEGLVNLMSEICSPKKRKDKK